MTDKKLTDSEIVKGLVEFVEKKDFEELVGEDNANSI